MSQKILLIGAGRSATHLIDYLISEMDQNDWALTITDMDLELAAQKVNGRKATVESLDISDPEKLNATVAAHDLVISMLPASMHYSVAAACLENGKHFVTASYRSDDIKNLDADLKAKGLVFLSEIGLDPGLDHLSAMSIINRLHAQGHYIREFESFTGGLVAPENDDNAWNYKFSWNPRNVVMSGHDGPVKFLQEGQYKYIPYHRVFTRTEIIDIENHGRFEGYANRDSLKYLETYGLQDIQTLYRGTLRRPGFCKAWNTFVSLGATDDSFAIENSENMTYREFINSFLAYHPTDSVELKLKYYLQIAQDEAELWHKLESLDLFKPIKIGLKKASPARILQHILEQKWTMKPHEKDMVVMWHKFVYMDGDKRHELHGSIVAKGEDQKHTSMSKTVGLPLGIATKLILQGKIKSRGALLPILPEFYEPILQELEGYGIAMVEKQIS